jgi:glycerol-3-phosphate dehydrogenase
MDMALEPTIVVLGAGINGAALARELVLSGAHVIVVDAADVAAGATAWSTRLIHGGLRYLEYGELGLVRESLAERNRLVRLAPHLVRPLPFYLPVRGRWGGLCAAAARLLGWESLARRLKGPRGRGSWTVGAGLSLYDLLAAGADWPRHAVVRAATAAGLPQVDAARFPWAALYADAQLLYPERFTVELLVDARDLARSAGTRFEVLTHRQVRLGADMDVMIGPAAVGFDRAACVVRPDAVVNATGAWVDRTLAEWPASLPRPGRLIGGTKGSHLVLRSPRLRAALAGHGVYAEAEDGRPVFVLPFGPALVLVGTTDIPYAGDPAEARADDAEIDYLLQAAARLFPAAAVDRGDVQQHYCGVRPLPAAPSARAAAGITRRHLLVRHPSMPVPTWSIVGGKLTTCRSLAETAAATVLETLGRPVRGTSRDRPLPGAADAENMVALVRRCGPLAAAAGLATADLEQAVAGTCGLFGSRAERLWTQAAERHETPGGEDGMIPDVGLPAAAVGFCAREEWAAALEDVVERRLMLSFHERLSRETIAGVARALAAAGAIHIDDVAAAAEACATRLERRYGRRLEAGPAP